MFSQFNQFRFCSSLIFVFSVIRTLDYLHYFVWSQRVRIIEVQLYNSCYYLFILQPEKFSHLTPCVYLIFIMFRFLGEQIGFEVLAFGPAGPDIEPGRCTFLSILVFQISFSSWISWFQNLEIWLISGVIYPQLT